MHFRRVALDEGVEPSDGRSSDNGGEDCWPFGEQSQPRGEPTGVVRPPRRVVPHVDLTGGGGGAQGQRPTGPVPRASASAAAPAVLPAAASRAPPAALPAALERIYLHASQIVTRERTPPSMMCPITLGLMRQPVIATDGYSYEAEAWEGLVRQSNGGLYCTLS